MRLNAAIIIVLFLYVTLGNIPNNHYGMSCLDFFLILCGISGFIWGILSCNCKDKDDKNDKKGGDA